MSKKVDKKSKKIRSTNEKKNKLTDKINLKNSAQKDRKKK